ncbi:MAG: hypothetical protein Q4D62_05435 [Planctomycetia bacterium]|nr:hypothetical protein [Planctomycetia bacterium]
MNQKQSGTHGSGAVIGEVDGVDVFPVRSRGKTRNSSCQLLHSWEMVNSVTPYFVGVSNASGRKKRTLP